jgi:hypothetical protein
MIQLPSAVALKVCQHTIQDLNTKHVSLVNCYRKLRFNKFPSEPQSFTVCAVLTDGLGEVELSVGISMLAAWGEKEDLIVQSWKEMFTDPLKEKWFLVRFSQFSFPEYGNYLFAISAAGEEIAHTTLEIQESSNESDEEP